MHRLFSDIVNQISISRHLKEKNDISGVAVVTVMVIKTSSKTFKLG